MGRDKTVAIIGAGMAVLATGRKRGMQLLRKRLGRYSYSRSEATVQCPLEEIVVPPFQMLFERSLSHVCGGIEFFLVDEYRINFRRPSIQGLSITDSVRQVGCQY